jgi:hypothetical protein
VNDARRLSIRLGAIVVGLLGIWVLGTSLYGVFAYYSPAQHWDQWNGALGFYLDARQGDWSSWWSQHNEHRILFPRLFFYLDLRWLGGRNYATIGLTWLMLAGNVVLLAWIGVRRRDLRWPERLFCAGMVLAFASSWAQHDNLVWGFQSQFVAVNFFALASFFAVYRSTESPASAWPWVLLAALCSFMSTLSMSNGLLGFLVLLPLAAWLRVGAVRLAFLSLVALLAWGLYFRGYHAFAEHGSIREALLHAPLEIVRFAWLYLGWPLYFVCKAEGATVALGCLMFVDSVITILHALHRRERDTGVVLLAMLLFVLGTAFATAAGRVLMKPSALSFSRYSTPALVGWACLLVYHLRKTPAWSGRVARAIGLMGVVLLAFGQPEALAHSDWAYERDLGALAARLGVFDDRFIHLIYPDTGVTERLVRRAEREGVRYGERALAPLGSTVPASTATCLGSIDEIAATRSLDYLQLRGWIYWDKRGEVPRRLLVTDADDRVIGEAVSGHARADVVHALGRRERGYGWTGFARGGATRFRVYGRLRDGSYCRLHNDKDPPLVLLQPVDGDSHAFDVIAVNGFAKGALPDLVKGGPAERLGSYVGGGAGTGSLILRPTGAARPVRVTYVTGPSNGSQILELIDAQGRTVYETMLPGTSDNWMTVEVRTALPFASLRVSDRGSGFGEWSAIGYRRDP